MLSKDKESTPSSQEIASGCFSAEVSYTVRQTNKIWVQKYGKITKSVTEKQGGNFNEEYKRRHEKINFVSKAYLSTKKIKILIIPLGPNKIKMVIKFQCLKFSKELMRSQL